MSKSNDKVLSRTQILTKLTLVRCDRILTPTLVSGWVLVWKVLWKSYRTRKNVIHLMIVYLYTHIYIHFDHSNLHKPSNTWYKFVDDQILILSRNLIRTRIKPLPRWKKIRWSTLFNTIRVSICSRIETLFDEV